MIKRLTIVRGPEKELLIQSLLGVETVIFTFSDGKTATLYVDTIHRGLGEHGVQYYLVAFPPNEDRTSDEDKYFLVYDPDQQKGECVWYTAEELDKLPHYVFHIPDYWAVAMKQAPAFR